MPPDSLVLKSNIVQGGTNAKPDNVIGNSDIDYHSGKAENQLE
jgi:hypothetical protein